MAYLFTKDIVYTIGSGTGFCEAMYEFKELLKSAGWTVIAWGTGTAGTYGVSGDPITAAILNASIGQNAFFVIQKPGTTCQWSFQRKTTEYSWIIKFSPGGFGAPSAPDVVPTPADQVGLFSGGTLSAPTAGYIVVYSGTHRAQIAADDAEPHNFYFLVHANGASTPGMMLFLDHMKTGSYPTEDVQPWIFGYAGNSAWSWFCSNCLTDSVDPPTGTAIVGYLSATTATPTNMVPIQAEYGTSIPGFIGTNPFNSKDDGFEILWSRKNNLTAPVGSKGVSTLLRWMGITRALGSTLSVSTTRDRYCIGNISLPWDGTVPNI